MTRAMQSVAVGKALDKAMGVRRLGSGNDLFVGGIGLCHADVVTHRARV